jgi:hypothetical protein
MWFCLVGALLCSYPGGLYIPGPLSYAPSSRSSFGFYYASYYGVPILGGNPLGLTFLLERETSGAPIAQHRGFTW